MKNDYYAIYRRADMKARANFLCNVLAKDKADALSTARKHGLRVTRCSYAVHIGREGYFQSLKAAS